MLEISQNYNNGNVAEHPDDIKRLVNLDGINVLLSPNDEKRIKKTRHFYDSLKENYIIRYFGDDKGHLIVRKNSCWLLGRVVKSETGDFSVNIFPCDPNYSSIRKIRDQADLIHTLENAAIPYTKSH